VSTKTGWSGGFAEWTVGDTAFLSIAFTWLLDQAYARALWYRALGYKVRAGGPALFLVKMKHELEDVAELGGEAPDAIARHNPAATVASRGCPGTGTEDAPKPCWFCIVPKMEGTRFTLLPDFPVRPVLCDVLIGNEPFEACMERIREVIAWGGEPHVQPYIKLNALERRPHVRFDWTEQKLRDVARWANGFVWRSVPFAEYDRTLKHRTAPVYDEQQGLFTEAAA
jgi:hypothetical protein